MLTLLHNDIATNPNHLGVNCSFVLLYHKPNTSVLSLEKTYTLIVTLAKHKVVLTSFWPNLSSYDYIQLEYVTRLCNIDKTFSSHGQ